MLMGQPVRQICYLVNDIEEAARRHVALYGSGPFFVVENPPLITSHKGRKVAFDCIPALGQWGQMQVEFLQINSGDEMLLRDLFPAGIQLHHVALFVDDLDAAVTCFTDAGHAEIARMSPFGTDITAVFVNTAKTYGHYVELYEPREPLVELYAAVAAAAVGYDGHDPIRRFSAS